MITKRLGWLSFAIALLAFSPTTSVSKPTQPNNSRSVQIQASTDTPEMLFSGNFSEGLAAVKIGEKFGFIDKTGKVIIPPKFDGADKFSDGLALVGINQPGTDKRKRGFIDKTGRFVIPPQFDYAYSFSDGLAKVEIGQDSRRSSYIDKTGKVILESIGETSFGFSEGFVRVCDPPSHPRGRCNFRTVVTTQF